MKVHVSARHTKISKRDQQLIEEKIDRLSKYLAGMETAEVHFSEEQNPRISEKEVCEVTLAGHGHHVRAKANGVDHLTAVDKSIDKLENKLHKLKSKLSRKPRHKNRGRRDKWKQGPPELPPDLVGEIESPPPEYSAVPEDYDDHGIEIVKMKSVEKLALTPHDAASRMDLVDHGFYFFTNIETGRPAVVYRREDGGVGLIDEID